jgi:glycosyltransferase involved in cell wall biosynthesis
VADDGSTDHTADIVRSYPEKVIYLKLEHAGMPAVPRNVALRITRGDYVAFLDSDDEWLPRKLEKQVAILDEHPEVGLVCSNAILKRESEDESEERYLAPGHGRNGLVLCDLLRDNFVITSTTVIRRSLLDVAGVFSDDLLLRGVEDYDLWLRIAAISALHYVPEPLAVYRDHGTSIHSTQSRIAYWRGRLAILARLKSRLRDLGNTDPQCRQVIREEEWLYRRELMMAYKRVGDYARLGTEVLRLSRMRPLAVLLAAFKRVHHRSGSARKVS